MTMSRSVTTMFFCLVHVAKTMPDHYGLSARLYVENTGELFCAGLIMLKQQCEPLSLNTQLFIGNSYNADK